MTDTLEIIVKQKGVADFKENTKILIDIIKPYRIHKIKANKTLYIGKTRTYECDLPMTLQTEELKGATCIEFYKEDASDTSTVLRAQEFHKNAIEKCVESKIKIRVSNKPSSHIDEYNKSEFNYYIIFCTTKINDSK